MTNLNSDNLLSDENLVKWYQKISVDDDKFSELYIARLQTFESPMLEINCGTGKIISSLCSSGIECDATEGALPQLEICKQLLEKSGKSPLLTNTDLSDFVTCKKYNTIFMSHGSFCLIGDYEKSINLLKAFYNSLQNHGYLLIDIFSALKNIILQRNNLWQFAGSAFDIDLDEEFVYSYSDSFDLFNQTCNRRVKYELFRASVSVASRTDLLQYRWYGANEFVLMLEKAGFTNIKYEKIFPESESDYSILFTAQKSE